MEHNWKCLMSLCVELKDAQIFLLSVIHLFKFLMAYLCVASMFFKLWYLRMIQTCYCVHEWNPPPPKKRATFHTAPCVLDMQSCLTCFYVTPVSANCPSCHTFSLSVLRVIVMHEVAYSVFFHLIKIQALDTFLWYFHLVLSLYLLSPWAHLISSL